MIARMEPSDDGAIGCVTMLNAEQWVQVMADLHTVIEASVGLAKALASEVGVLLWIAWGLWRQWRETWGRGRHRLLTSKPNRQSDE
jgi:hypothetical protein